MSSLNLRMHFQKSTKNYICKFYNNDNKKIGYFIGVLEEDEFNNTYLQISKIEVYPKFRKFGFATEILRTIFTKFKQEHSIKYLKPKAIYASAKGFWDKQYIQNDFIVNPCYDIIDGF